MNILYHFRSILKLDRPTKAQKNTIIKMLALIIWSDGHCDPKEIESISLLMSSFGGISQNTCIEVLQNTKESSPELMDEISSLPSQYAQMNLKMAYHIANSDGNISESELAMIQKISEKVLQGKNWEDIKVWIESYDSFVKATHKLF
jgi:tellurite resistance protein